MALYASDGTRLNQTKEVDEGVMLQLTCEVLDTRPAVTIQWFLNDVLQRSLPAPVSGGDDGVVSTNDTWSFLPLRVHHHRQEVKCVASTPDSQQPYPYVAVELDVAGIWRKEGTTSTLCIAQTYWANVTRYG